MNPKERREGAVPHRSDRRAFLDKACRIAVLGVAALGSLPAARRAKATTKRTRYILDPTPTVKPRLNATRNRTAGIIEPDRLGLEVFMRNLHTRFRVWNAPDLLDAELIAVKDRRLSGDHRTPDDGEAFSIVFRIARDHTLRQATYRFGHGTIGAFPLFIVPIHSDREYGYYEACFNRSSVGRR